MRTSALRRGTAAAGETLTVHEAEEEDQEVEPPQHLQDAGEGIVVRHVEEGEVSEAGHPHVARDQDADAVVKLHRVHVVIQQEYELHPSLPLFRLVSVQHFVFG